MHFIFDRIPLSCTIYIRSTNIRNTINIFLFQCISSLITPYLNANYHPFFYLLVHPDLGIYLSIFDPDSDSSFTISITCDFTIASTCGSDYVFFVSLASSSKLFSSIYYSFINPIQEILYSLFSGFHNIVQWYLYLLKIKLW